MERARYLILSYLASTGHNHKLKFNGIAYFLKPDAVYEVRNTNGKELNKAKLKKLRVTEGSDFTNYRTTCMRKAEIVV